MLIVPTILTTHLAEFERQFIRMLPWCKTFQIDIQDGKYVPSSTLSVEDLYIFFSSADESKLNIFQTATFDFHLMELNYANSIKTLRKLAPIIPIRYVFTHTNIDIESKLVSDLVVCPALSPEDAIDRYLLGSDIQTYPAIQVMTIHPGPQGQIFMIGELDKVCSLRTFGFGGQIMIDGCVNDDSIKQMKGLPPSYLPDVLCVGSYFSKCPDESIQTQYTKLNQLIT